MKLTFPDFDETEIDNLRQCLDSGWVTQGPFVQRFERAVARAHEVQFALATTSCTAALHLAALALELAPGEEVIVPAFTWVTSAHAAEYVGARAVFVDVDPTTYNIDTARLREAVNQRTRAIIAVHLFGLAADMDAINTVAREHGLKVIEDAACAIGSHYRGRPVGGLGDLGCFSFHPRKIVTTGEGGMVTTNDAELAEVIGSLRNHGATGIAADAPAVRAPWTMSTFNRLGFNLRLSDIQAAVGVAQMHKLDRLLHERRRAAERYGELLSEVDELMVPQASDDISGHSFQSYVVRVLAGGRERRNAVMSALDSRGIESRPGTHAAHTLGYYRERYGIAEQDFPNAALCQDTTITLPLFPGITVEQQRLVADVVKSALSTA